MKKLYLIALKFDYNNEERCERIGYTFAETREDLISEVQQLLMVDYPTAYNITIHYMEEVRVKPELLQSGAKIVVDTNDDNRIKLEVSTIQSCSSRLQHTYNVRGYTQTNVFEDGAYPHCTCEAYKWAKHTVEFNGKLYPPHCKHLRSIYAEKCGWQGATASNYCPKCMGKLV